MESQIFQVYATVAGLLITCLGFCVAWWVNNIWAQVKSQQEQISKLALKLAEGYVPRQELEKTFERIFEKLDEIQKEVRHMPA